jgi:hypothetical protein
MAYAFSSAGDGCLGKARAVCEVPFDRCEWRTNCRRPASVFERFEKAFEFRNGGEVFRTACRTLGLDQRGELKDGNPSLECVDLPGMCLHVSKERKLLRESAWSGVEWSQCPHEAP